MEPETHRDAAAIADGRAYLAAAPTDCGTLELLVRRPGVDQREVLDTGVLSVVDGLIGDTWPTRPSKYTRDGLRHPDMQLTIMSTRVLAAIADRDRWPLAGDQLLVDLDLSPENLPAGTRLHLGDAVVEVTGQPHTGCAKFAARFGPEALRFVNTGEGKRGRYRGLNARVVVPGHIAAGGMIPVERPTGVARSTVLQRLKVCSHCK